MQPAVYSLIDCGGGRRLERFSGIVVSRPAPAASFPPALSAAAWAEAWMTYDREGGWRGAAPRMWQVAFGAAVLNLRPMAKGQLGVFPEHAAAAGILDETLCRRGPGRDGLCVLNLFAHTGLATLRLAARGDVAETAHVDASPAALRLARENAAASNLESARIRWIEDDALAFMSREIRRRRKYDVILADPPAYGRCRKRGGEWRLGRDLPVLLRKAGELLAQDGGILCLTCHSEGMDRGTAEGMAREFLPGLDSVSATRLFLTPESGAEDLPCGVAVIAASGAG